MRHSASRFVRTTAAAASLVMVAAACSIQAPDITLSGQGGGGGGAGGVAGQAGTGTAGQTIGGGSSGGGVIGGGGKTASECVGKSTDTGVTGTEIKLGGTFALSGPVSNISGPILKGVQAFFNEVNKTGIHGRKIKLVVEDDGWDAQKGRAFIKKLVEQDKVLFLTVVPSSNGLDAAKTYLEDKGVPVFGTSGLIESQFTSPMQWPVGTSTKSAARIGLKYLKETGAKNIAFIWLDLLAGQQAKEATIEGIKNILKKDASDFMIGGTNGYRINISEPDFAPVWQRIIDDTKEWQDEHNVTQDGRPDVVSFAIDPTNAIKALQAAENLGFRPKKYWGGAAPLFLDLVWQSAPYARTTGLLAGTSYYPPIEPFKNDNQAVKDYIAVMKKYYGNAVDLNNPYLEGGYVGAALTVEILKRLGPCVTRKGAVDMANSLKNISLAGLTRPISFSAGNHYGNIAGLTVKVKSGGGWKLDHDWIEDPTPGAK